MSNTGGANNPAGAHLMVCVAMTADGGAIIVPIVSRHEYSDESCLIEIGDHPFIKHDSCAAYDYIRKISLAAINADIDAGLIKAQASVSAEVLVRLQIGIVTSDEIAPWAFEAAGGEKLKLWLKKKGRI